MHLYLSELWSMLVQKKNDYEGIECMENSP